jgi:SAM-dependent methyltransferase
MYKYNAEFYEYINRGAEQSAEVVVPALLSLLPKKIISVLDVGCGVGAWLSVWKRNGCRVAGLDGAYVEKSMLMIDAAEFCPQDLAKPFSPAGRFDLTQCLEVAEHLPESVAVQFVDSLCTSSDIILFSAAPPGQGGENHINEQHYQYWQALFEKNNYQMYDAVREKIIGNKDVKPWYRFNSFLYVKRNILPEVHDSLMGFRVEPGQVPVDKSPLLYQLRKILINLIPSKLKTQIAVLKKKLLISMQRSYG